MNASALHTIALQKQSPTKPKTVTGTLAILGLTAVIYIVLPAIRGTSVIKAWKETH